jgi:hypothetical protein
MLQLFFCNFPSESQNQRTGQCEGVLNRYIVFVHGLALSFFSHQIVQSVRQIRCLLLYHLISRDLKQLVIKGVDHSSNPEIIDEVDVGMAPVMN